LSDGPEVLLWATNPLVEDTDGDGVSDADEVAAFSNPHNAAVFPAQPPPVQTALSPGLVQLAGATGTVSNPQVLGATNWSDAGSLFVRERISGGSSLELRTRLFLKFDLSGLTGSLIDARLRVHQYARLNTNSGANYTSTLEVGQVTQPWGTNAGSFPVFDQTLVTNEFIFGGNEDFGTSTNAKGFYSGTPGVSGTNDAGFDPSGQVTFIVNGWLAGTTANHGFRVRLNPAYTGVAFSPTNNAATDFDERLQLLLTMQPPAASLDSDGDRLLDSWELAHTNSLAGFSGTGDADGDGAMNALELAMGSDPFNAASKPALNASSAGGQVQFHFLRSLLAGYGYELQCSGDLRLWKSWANTLNQLPATPFNTNYEQVNFSIQPSVQAALFCRLLVH